MRIREIQVERFGVWRDLSLEVRESGISLFYGPNEAGKTTLMRFIRGVLYGFPPSHSAGATKPGPEPARREQAGALHVVRGEERFAIRRVAQPDGRGLVSVARSKEQPHHDSPSAQEPDILEIPVACRDQSLSELLSETDEAVFERVFAIGLQELQELATLHTEEVAGRIYGITLGPEGRQILDVAAELEQSRLRLYDPDRGTGTLAELLAEDERLAAELRALDGRRDRYAALSRESQDVAHDIEQNKARRRGLQRELEGCRLLEQVHGPWSTAEQLRAERDELPIVAAFPENGLDRLKELDGEIDSLRRCRESLRAEARKLRQDADALKSEAALSRHAAVIGSLAEQRDWIAELQAAAAGSARRASQADAQLEEGLRALGGEWTRERLEKADTSPPAYGRLLEAADRYRTAARRYAWFRGRYKRRVEAYRRAAADWREAVKDIGGETIHRAIEEQQQRLDELRERNRLRFDEARLEERRSLLADRLLRVQENPPLPRWAYLVLAFFGVLGVIIAVVGFYTGVTFNGIAGLMYAFIGTACSGTAYALKTHVEAAVGDNSDRLQDELRGVEIDLREIREAIARIEADPSGVPLAERDGRQDALGQTGARDEAVFEATARLSELQHLADTERGLQRRRQLLSRLRARFQDFRRELSSAREAWCRLLKELGLTETVDTEQAVRTWRQLREIRQRLEMSRQAAEDAAGYEQVVAAFRQRVTRLSRELGPGDVEGEDPLTVLEMWQEQLEADGRKRQQRRSLQAEARRRLREASGYRKKIEKLKTQRAALLVQGGAADRREFEQRAGWKARRKQLQEMLAAAEAELTALTEAHRELAVTEDDLRAFDAGENARRIERLAGELEQNDRDGEQMHERLGRTRQEMAALASDRTAARLRFERAQVRHRLKEATEEWLSVRLAASALGAVRNRFERSNQPRTLAAASEFLAQLTAGRHQSVWTPLGERHLRVDDEQGRCFGVEGLSRGAREQLFLAVRLAVVKDFLGRGVELPMVLDDVLVNFDTSRTEAAVRTLLQFAAEGQQILFFTCHEHLVELFGKEGIEAVRLPQIEPAHETRRAG